MAEVFVATVEGAAGFEKSVAIKRILPHLCEDPDFIEMFREEARLASRLSHANIAQVFDFDEIDGQCLLAMEWVNGKDLRKVLRAAEKAGRQPSPARAAFIAREVARALHHAHTAPAADGRPLCLVHRDVSPQNVLLSFAGEVKLTDFGIAKAATRSIATSTGVIKGKCAYMSPEQTRGEDLDARSDIFALGIVLFEALTGRRLFTGQSDMEILRAVRERPAPVPSDLRADVPKDLDAVVMQALSKNRDERQKSALELETALTEIVLRHATGADDLDFSAWLGDLFERDNKEEIVTRGDIRAKMGDRRGETRQDKAQQEAKAQPQDEAQDRARQDKAPPPSSPTPPEPLRAGGPAPQAPGGGEALTKDLPASTPKGRRALRHALMALAAIGIGAAITMTLLLLPARQTQPPGEPAAHPESQEPEESPASMSQHSGPLAGREDMIEASPLLPLASAPKESLEASNKAPSERPLEASEGDGATSPAPRRLSTPRPPRRSAEAERRPGGSRSSPGARQESPSIERPVGIATVLSPPQETRAQTEEPSRLLPAGTRLTARLILGVRTDGRAPVEARLVRSGVAGNDVLLPRDTRLLGRAMGRGERVAIEFDRTILPTGREARISAVAFGGDGHPGLPALDVLTSGEAKSGDGEVLTLAPGTDLTVVLTGDLVLP